MNILLKSAKIIDPTSSFHGNTLDILIRKGIIDNIGKNISAPKATIISHQNLCVSPGGLTAVCPLVNLVMRNEKPYPMGFKSLLPLALRTLATIPTQTPTHLQGRYIFFAEKCCRHPHKPTSQSTYHSARQRTTTRRIARLISCWCCEF